MATWHGTRSLSRDPQTWPRPGMDDAGRLNVRLLGGIGDGVADDTAAIQTALNAALDPGDEVVLPAGVFRFSAPLRVKAGTTISGPGTLLAAPIGQWAGGPYFGLTNQNADASTITDTEITVRNITIDYSLLPSADGTRHGIYMRKARRVRIEAVTVLGCSSAVALLGCDDTEENGNTYLGFSNCGSDHWDKPSNGRVINCHIETAFSAQMLNWNPDPTDATSAGDTANSLVVLGCVFLSTENPSTPIQIEPLRTGGIVKGVTFVGNKLRGVSLVMRGDTRGAIVDGNEFSDFIGSGEAITGYTRVGGTPSDIQIIGNTVRDPLTSVGSVAVIRMESPTATIAFNRISGTGYGALPVSVGATTGQIFGNQVDGTPVAGYLQTGFVVPNGSANYHGWKDNGGGTPRMYVQSSDNNFIFHGTDASGAQRTIWSVIMRSGSSEWTVSVPQINTAAWRSTPDAAVAAAGSNIGTAAALTRNFSNVTSATAGTAEGVSLAASVGRPQTVTNSTAITIKVYPNNSGSSQIDAGGANVHVTLAAGKSKTFMGYTATDFRTISEY